MIADYPNLRRICYGEGEFEGAHFIPVCPQCGRFVKADDTVTLDYQGQPATDNATCKKHGRVQMPFEGYV